MKKILYIILSILIETSVNGQAGSQIDTVSFDKLLNKFKESIGWNALAGQINDSVSTSLVYQTKDFKVSISDKPIAFETIYAVIENPYYTDDFDDYDDNYINYPVSYSVIYDDRLVSLFRNGKFVCHSLSNLKRDLDFENELNTRKFRYHWIVDNKLGAISGNSIFVWNGNKWANYSTKFPLSKQPKLFEDTEYVVYRDCNGEFGGTVYFFDKTSGKTYYTESTCANTVIKKDNKYFVLAQLGHMTGSSEVKIIDNPHKLTIARKTEINKTRKDLQALGYKDKSQAYKITLDFWGIQFFSTFKYENRQLFMVHLNELTFLAENVDNEIQIVHPLFNNEIYTHEPITNAYGKYTLLNLDFYGIARDKEVTVIIIVDGKIVKLDWNEDHNR